MKAVLQTILTKEGKRVRARWVKHLGTLTESTPGRMFSGSCDRDLYRDVRGNEYVCQSPENDGRAIPEEES